MNATPPAWADALLRIVLKPADVDSVSGDLLEEYRESILPTRGRRRANVWYVMQVCGFVWRAARLWGMLLGAAVIARTALDWFAPPVDFHTRAAVSTYLGSGLLATTGVWAAWRSGSVITGTFVGGAAGALGALAGITGTVGLLAIRHDPQTMAAIRGSGGLAEALTLPLFLILIGALLGTVGGIAGVAGRRLLSAQPKRS